MTVQSPLTRSIGARNLSRGIEAQWSDMDREAIRLWLSDHGEEGEQLHRDVLMALVRFGGWIKATQAHEKRGAFNVEEYVNAVLDSACRPLAPEVREYLGS